MRSSYYIISVGIAALLLSACSKFDRSKIKMPEFDFVTTENLHSIACVDREHIWLSGNYGTILFSSDGGTTWQAQDSGIDELLLCCIAFADERNGWAAGVGGTMLHTADGGSAWVRQDTGADGNILDIFFLDERRGWAVGEFGMVIHTRDGGGTWVSQREPTDTLFNDVFFADELTGWIVGEFGTILHTRDGGETWQAQECPDLEQQVDEYDWERPMPALYGLWFVDNSTGWIVGMDGVILHTDSGGASWKRIASGTDKPLYGITVHGRTGWIVGNKGVFIASTDGGATWQVQEGLIKTKYWLRDVACIDEGAGIIVGARGTLARKGNEEASWDLISGFRYDMEEYGLADF